jgi:hypothetical protein
MLSTSVNAAVDTVTLYWDTTDHGATPVGWMGSLSLGTRPAGAISHLLTGLAENTTYFFRFHAAITSPAQEAWSAAGTFTTPFENPPAGTVIQPVGVTGHTANAGGFPTINVINGSGMSGVGDVLTQTHAPSTGTGANPAWIGGISQLNSTQPLVFNLGGTYNIDAVHVWQYTDTASATFNNFGTSAFNISFSTDGGASYGTPIPLSGFTQGTQTHESVQTRTFAVQSGVTHIKFNNFAAFNGATNAGLGEVRFGGQTTTPGDSYGGWAAGPWSGTLTDDSPTLDFDGGGLDTGIEWVVGGDPTDGSDDSGNAPTFDNGNATHFIFTFKRRDAAGTDANTDIAVEYGSNLSGWAEAVHGTDGVTIDDSTDLGGGFHQVNVAIPRALAPGDKLFARLKVTVTTTP